MTVLWALVAGALSLAGKPDFRTDVLATPLVDAKNALVDAALAVRRGRVDWEEAEAGVEEAEARLEAVQAQQGRALEERKPWQGAHSLASAELKLQTALRALDIFGGRLSRAEKRLQTANAALNQAEKALASP